MSATGLTRITLYLQDGSEFGHAYVPVLWDVVLVKGEYFAHQGDGVVYRHCSFAKIKLSE